MHINCIGGFNLPQWSLLSRLWAVCFKIRLSSLSIFLAVPGHFWSYVESSKWYQSKAMFIWERLIWKDLWYWLLFARDLELKKGYQIWIFDVEKFWPKLWIFYKLVYSGPFKMVPKSFHYKKLACLGANLGSVNNESFGGGANWSKNWHFLGLIFKTSIFNFSKTTEN